MRHRSFGTRLTGGARLCFVSPVVLGVPRPRNSFIRDACCCAGGPSRRSCAVETERLGTPIGSSPPALAFICLSAPGPDGRPLEARQGVRQIALSSTMQKFVAKAVNRTWSWCSADRRPSQPTQLRHQAHGAGRHSSLQPRHHEKGAHLGRVHLRHAL